MNVPYVKKYDENMELSNPINGRYASPFPNRQARRPKKNRFFNNSNSHQMTVSGSMRYRKSLQIEVDKEGNQKYIYHYLKP